MKVRCIRYENESAQAHESWLCIGKVYHVLGIYVEAEGATNYRITTNEVHPLFATTAYFPSSCFETVSTIVPSSWKVEIMANSDISIDPIAWIPDGFMEAFYDRDPGAYSVFKHERDLIVAEDP